MKDGDPCVTCPVREKGFCGLLLGKPFQQSPVIHNSNWQEHQGFGADARIVNSKDVSDFVYVLCDGWAFRFGRMPDNRRQIFRFLLPGDLFTAINVFEEKLHSSFQALTNVRVSRFKRPEVMKRIAIKPEILATARIACVVESKHADELSINLGVRAADERIAYLLLHLTSRIADRSVIREHRYHFPLRHQHIADAVGLTTVHVSRVISIFRKRKIIELRDGLLEVLDPPELARIGAIELSNH